jgi:hypothetical protein
MGFSYMVDYEEVGPPTEDGPTAERHWKHWGLWPGPPANWDVEHSLGTLVLRY